MGMCFEGYGMMWFIIIMLFIAPIAGKIMGAFWELIFGIEKNKL